METIDKFNLQETKAEELLFELGFRTKRYLYDENNVLKVAVYYKDYFYSEGEEKTEEPFDVIDSFWVYSNKGSEGIRYVAGSNVTTIYEKDLSQKEKDIIKLWKEERNLS